MVVLHATSILAILDASTTLGFAVRMRVTWSTLIGGQVSPPQS